ncbi:hypothetical protein BH23GEM9_BH23GEM9_26680 [soil metagenome]
MGPVPRTENPRSFATEPAPSLRCGFFNFSAPGRAVTGRVRAGAKRAADRGPRGGVIFALIYRNDWAVLLGSLVGAAPGTGIVAAVGASGWEPVRTGY